MIAPAVVHFHAVKRRGQAVLLTLETDQGKAEFRFTPEAARLAGSELRIRGADTPAGERTPDPSPRPVIEKPGGGIV